MVGVTLAQPAVLAVRPAVGDVVLSTVLLLEWQDDRLAWDPADWCGSTALHNVGPSEGRAWLPPVLFDAAAQDPDAVSGVRDTLSISASGAVRLRRALVLVVPCPADMGAYPFDAHSCPLRVPSQPQGPRFYAAQRSTTLPESGGYEIGISISSARGEVTAELRFERRWGRHIPTQLVPLWVAVLISCTGPIVDMGAVSARCALAALPLLCIAALMAKGADELPAGATATALDAYHAICLASVVANLIEFAFVHSAAVWIEQNEAEARRLLSLRRQRQGRDPQQQQQQQQQPVPPRAQAAAEKAVCAELVELFRAFDHSQQGVAVGELAAALASFADDRGLRLECTELQEVLGTAAEETPGGAAVVAEQGFRWLIAADLGARLAHARPLALRTPCGTATRSGLRRFECIFQQAHALAFVFATVIWILAGIADRALAAVVVAVFGAVFVAGFVAVRSRLAVGAGPRADGAAGGGGAAAARSAAAEDPAERGAAHSPQAHWGGYSALPQPAPTPEHPLRSQR
eukprot:TRINITY_DN15195_c0_g1_i3.p1 TRINITY_DN15195_c0_g1~~TRINITY_DN15195_c0_g1_i3.p1  ORF type:complete len:594 (+),score=178.37 TRINITY_DN15195_c0_g1_i3:225-1784(+)